MLILNDAEIDAVVETAVYSAFFNSGARTAAPPADSLCRRVYTTSLLSASSPQPPKITVGDPTDPKTKMGPLAYNACRDTAEHNIESAKKAGFKCLSAEERPNTPETKDGAYVYAHHF
jgi:acyl-CoA reductase-like NAD-dependent aldehyde dehydrogenase